MTTSDHTRLQQLARLAHLVSDRALATLAERRHACQISRDHLAALTAPMPASPELPAAPLAMAALRHQCWAEPQRARLNLQLANQMVAQIIAEQTARQAFGRAAALDQLVRATRRRDG